MTYDPLDPGFSERVPPHSNPINLADLREFLAPNGEGHYRRILLTDALALVEVVEAARGPIGQWSREGETANKRLNAALDRFDFGDAA